MTKIAGSGSGSISQRYGSAVPDPYQIYGYIALQEIPLGTVLGIWIYLNQIRIQAAAESGFSES